MHLTPGGVNNFPRLLIYRILVQYLHKDPTLLFIKSREQPQQLLPLVLTMNGSILLGYFPKMM